jgi:hypothetical protein
MRRLQRALIVALAALLVGSMTLLIPEVSHSSPVAGGLWNTSADGRVTLHWTPPDGAWGFDVMRNGQYRGKTTQRSFTDTINNTDWQEHSYVVRSFFSDGSTTDSAPFTVWAIHGTPPTPPNAAIATTIDEHPHLHWPLPPDHSWTDINHNGTWTGSTTGSLFAIDELNGRYTLTLHRTNGTTTTLTVGGPPPEPQPDPTPQPDPDPDPAPTLTGRAYGPFNEVPRWFAEPGFADETEAVRAGLAELFVEFYPYRVDNAGSRGSQERQLHANFKIFKVLAGLGEFTPGHTIGVRLLEMLDDEAPWDPALGLTRICEGGNDDDCDGFVRNAWETADPQELAFFESWFSSSIETRLTYLGIPAEQAPQIVAFAEALRGNFEVVAEYKRAKRRLIAAIVVGAFVGAAALTVVGPGVAGYAAAGAASSGTVAALTGGDLAEVVTAMLQGGVLGAAGGKVLAWFDSSILTAASRVVGPALQYQMAVGDLRVGAIAGALPIVEDRIAARGLTLNYDLARDEALAILGPLMGSDQANRFIDDLVNSAAVGILQLETLATLAPEADMAAEAARIDQVLSNDLLTAAANEPIRNAVRTQVSDAILEGAEAGAASDWNRDRVLDAIAVRYSGNAFFFVSLFIDRRDRASLINDITDAVMAANRSRPDLSPTELVPDVRRLLSGSWDFQLSPPPPPPPPPSYDPDDPDNQP